jgi:recombination protein RecA
MSSIYDKVKRQNSKVSRFSSGIFAIDAAIGQGFPRGRVCMIVGQESSGKSTIAVKTAASISKIDWETGEFGGKTKVVYIDMENTFDAEWAKGLGWPDDGEVLVPSAGDEAADLICELLTAGNHGLIIADSLDMFYPAKFDERLATDGGLPGIRAQLLNQSFIKWTNILRNSDAPPHKMPTLLCLNQYRYTMGTMMSDPRVIPGGVGQMYYNSVILSMNTPKVSDGGGSECSILEAKGVVRKSKVGVPKRNFNFTIGLADSEELARGEVANHKSIMDVLKTTAIEKVKSKYTLLGKEYDTQKQISDKMKNDPAFLDVCWKLALEQLNKGKE